jgi:hypothetical protein
LKRFLVLVTCLVTVGPTYAQEDHADTSPARAPDIREDELRLKAQKGNVVAVPIPMSNPTLDTGLVAGGAYFYGQSPEQKKSQPASVTGMAGMYTSNDSWAIGIFHDAYWDDDNWRFTGLGGIADVRLSLITPGDAGSDDGVSWRVQGAFVDLKMSRRILGDWYAGGVVRVIDAEQSIEFESGDETAGFDLGADVRAAGVGATFEYDTRDIPTGPYAGMHFTAEGLYNSRLSSGNDGSYQTYSLAFRSYHQLSDSLVLAWEARGCARGGTVPLWDACRIQLRGFAAFDYLGQESVSGQAELRWRAWKRLGLVAFGGGGWAGESFATAGDDETTPSYGFGIRYEVLPAKRLNMRLDFGWSENSNGIYLSVGEAF